jgi:hypothetical protein
MQIFLLVDAFFMVCVQIILHDAFLVVCMQIILLVDAFLMFSYI